MQRGRMLVTQLATCHRHRKPGFQKAETQLAAALLQTHFSQ
jgi:hypothetical protein